jgi:voltage-gated potassium channel
VVLVGLGTTGYVLVEHWSVFDALYMTVITLTTVGFMEIHPLTPPGRAFTMLLSLGGVFTLFYAATTTIQWVVGGQLRGEVGRRRMQKTLAALRNHVIVCGYGRMGRLVAQEFSTLRRPFVVVDLDAKAMEDFAVPHGIAYVGDATSDDTLRAVGVERAAVLVTVAASDADNLFITMSARLLNEKLNIVARAEEEGAEPKLLRAGASRVVAPYVIGGHRMALAVTRPAVVDFLELATRHDFLDVQMEEIAVAPGSTLAGQRLRDTNIRQDLGVIIVSIRKADGRNAFNPPAEHVLEPGDLLITLGHPNQLDRLEALAGPASPRT